MHLTPLGITQGLSSCAWLMSLSIKSSVSDSPLKAECDLLPRGTHPAHPCIHPWTPAASGRWGRGGCRCHSESPLSVLGAQAPRQEGGCWPMAPCASLPRTGHAVSTAASGFLPPAPDPCQLRLMAGGRPRAEARGGVGSRVLPRGLPRAWQVMGSTPVVAGRRGLPALASAVVVGRGGGGQTLPCHG